MTAWRLARQLSLAMFVSAIAISVHAQSQANEQFTPHVGQAGKDVIWVPSPQALVDKMLDMAKVTPSDFVIDLGSGDGRTVITAAKRGAHALGIEYNPDMVALSRRNAEKAGVGGMAKFVNADIFQSDFSKASVITMFLLTDLNLKLRPTILSLKPGTRIVSNTFKMGEWEPDQTFELGCDTYCTAYLWIVPAKVEGKWRLAHGELTLHQEFQKVTGTLKNGASALSISQGRLHGDEISFAAGGSEYRGRLRGKAIEGTVRKGGSAGAWSAQR